MARKPVVFINFFMHTMDPINVEHSHPIIHRILDLFEEVGVPADIYLQSSLAATIVESEVDPELAARLRRVYESGWGMAILRDSAHPKPEELYGGLSWDEGGQAAKRYQSQRRDVVNGELDASRPGGAELFRRAFGRYPDIASRESVTEAYYLRERGAFMTLGFFPQDWVSTWVKPPLAWFMGMLAVYLYPGRTNMRDIIFWPTDPRRFDREFRQFMERLPEADYHFIYIGGHNVDMYADNPRWNKLNRGSARHIESWAFLDGNPPSLDAARIPGEFFYPRERVEELFGVRRAVLENFRRNVDREPGMRIVTCRELRDAIEHEARPKLSREEVVAVARFLKKNIRRGVPEYVTVGRRHFTLAEAYQALLFSLDAFHREGWLPVRVEVDSGLLGPVEIPIEWRPHGVRGLVDGIKPPVEQVAECAAQVAAELPKAKYPAVPVHTLGPWGHPPLNAAELLAAMARAVVMLADGKRGKVPLRYVSMYPEAVHWSANPWLDDQHLQMFAPSHKLTALQLWTIKPAVLRKGYR